MKKCLTLLCSLFLIAGCASGQKLYTAGDYEATSVGFGGEVSVKLTVSESKIENVEIVGADETPEIGGAVIESLKEAIMKANGAEIEVVSGATLTSNAVITAYNSALAKAKGEKVAAKSVADGEYVTKAMGHEDWVYVTTAFKDGAIAKCEVTAHEETMGIGNYGAAEFQAESLKHKV